jgi:hypothetical protein
MKRKSNSQDKLIQKIQPADTVKMVGRNKYMVGQQISYQSQGYPSSLPPNTKTDRK